MIIVYGWAAKYQLMQITEILFYTALTFMLWLIIYHIHIFEYIILVSTLFLWKCVYYLPIVYSWTCTAV